MKRSTSINLIIISILLIIPGVRSQDKFDDNWTMHMFMGHKYTSGRKDKEGCLATEILIKNY